MDINELKIKILSESGLTTAELDEACEELRKLDSLYNNDELAYWTIARELGIDLTEERETAGKSKPPAPTLTLEEAKNELEDGEFFNTKIVVLAPFRAPKETIGFLPIADETMKIDLKFFEGSHDKGREFEVGKTYLIKGIQSGENENYGWGISFAKYTKFEELPDERIIPKCITPIDVLKDSWETYVIKGVIEDFKEANIDLEFCEKCHRYAGTSDQVADEESFFCPSCQETVETYTARPYSGKLLDASGSVRLSFPAYMKEFEFYEGDKIIVSGGYSEKTKKFYVRGVLHSEEVKSPQTSLLKFLKKKKKKPKKKSEKIKERNTNKVREAYSEYIENKSNYGDLKIPSDIKKIFDLQTEDEVREFVSEALINGEAILIDKTILRAVG